MMNNASIELPNESFILPKEIAMWPPAWHFWLTLGVLICVILVSTWLFYKRYTSRRYRHEALKLLINIDEHTSDSELIRLSLESIRRTLITEKKESLASLPTEALLLRLDQQSKTKKYAFSSISSCLAHGLYRPDTNLSSEQRQQIVTITRTWIRKHHA